MKKILLLAVVVVLGITAQAQLVDRTIFGRTVHTSHLGMAYKAESEDTYTEAGTVKINIPISIKTDGLTIYDKEQTVIHFVAKVKDDGKTVMFNAFR